MNKTIAFTGINRTTPQQDATDGSCQEIINARKRKGAWRAIGPRDQVSTGAYTKADGGASITFNEIYLHDIEGGYDPGSPNWIGVKFIVSNDIPYASLYLIDTADGKCYLIEADLPSLWSNPVSLTNPSLSVVFLKRTMIVTSSAGLYVYLFDSTTKIYNKLGSLPVPYVNLTVTPYYNPEITNEPLFSNSGTLGSIESEEAFDPAAVLGNFYAAVNQESADHGRLFGSIMYMVAYRLFDGSYIMQSIPRYKEISNVGYLYQHNPNSGQTTGWADARWRWLLTTAAVSGTIVTTSYVNNYQSMQDIVSDVIVFATKVTPIHRIDDTVVTEKMLQATDYDGWNYVDDYRTLSFIAPLNSPDFESLCKSTGWYQILEFPYTQILADLSGSITTVADTVGFYQDYATRQNLPTDQFSHHGLVAKSAYTYNDRLHIGSVKTIFGEPYVLWAGEVITGYTQYYDVPGTITVRLSTSLGKVTVVYQATFPRYYDDTLGGYVYIVPGIIGYNDSRATHMVIALDISGAGSYSTVMSVDLKKNTGMNFSYYHSPTFAVTNAPGNNYSHSFIASLGATYEVPAETDTLFDTNRVQVSEIQNPLVYQAKNSYQVGTGEVIALSSGTEAMSSGTPFGSFPLQVLTTKGIWALQQGSGDILYSNVLPVNGEVVNNAKNVISIGGGVIYSTVRGLYLLEGMKVTEFSQVVEGNPVTELKARSEIVKLLTDSRFTPALEHCLSSVDFLTYLVTSRIGYDKINNELIVSSSSYAYSYFFSFENKYWAKVGYSYSLLINDYPHLLGLRGSFIERISCEETEGNTEVIIISNALSLEMPDAMKKIERMIARCVITTQASSQAGFYLFATDDLKTYQLVTGRQRTGNELKDLMLSRSFGSSRYYVIVFNAAISINFDLKDSHIGPVDISFVTKLAQKIR